MELTIEKAKEILINCNHKLCCDEDECMEASIFIEGWNQAIETIEKGFLSSTKPFDLNDLEKLKVNGEK